MKRLTALTLLFALQFSFCIQAQAIQDNINTAEQLNSTTTEKKDSTKKEKKSWNLFKKKNKDESLKAKVEYINTDWWSSFQDPYLSEYIALALQKNHDMKIATISTEEYYQNYKIQFGTELPQIGVGFSPALVKMPGTSDSIGVFSLPGIANYEADIFLKNRDKTKSVQKQYEASLIDERAAYIAVASAVGTVYFNIVRMDKTIELQKEINNQRQEIYNLMVLSNKEGLASTADTVRANKALVKGQSDLIELEKQREKLLNQLAVLVGESPENKNSLKRITLDELIIANKIPAQVSSEIIENRPDYLRAAKMVEKAGIDVRVAKKEFLPTINLTGLAFFNSFADFGSLFTTKNMLWSLAAGAMLPVFTGGKRIANLRLKKAQYERVLQEYLKTNLQAIQEVNDAMVSANLDWEKLSRTLEQQKLEEKDFNYNQMKYDQGVISKLDLIQFRENLLTINQLVAQQKTEYLVDYIGLYKACGARI